MMPVRQVAAIQAAFPEPGSAVSEAIYGSMIGYATRQIERSRRSKNGQEHEVTPRLRFLARTQFDNIDHLQLRGSRNAHAYHQISID